MRRRFGLDVARTNVWKFLQKPGCRVKCPGLQLALDYKKRKFRCTPLNSEISKISQSQMLNVFSTCGHGLRGRWEEGEGEGEGDILIPNLSSPKATPKQNRRG